MGVPLRLITELKALREEAFAMEGSNWEDTKGEETLDLAAVCQSERRRRLLKCALNYPKHRSGSCGSPNSTIPLRFEQLPINCAQQVLNRALP
jgi:hypothetical protein